MKRLSRAPNQMTSGEMMVTLAKRCPTNSGCDDGRLFFGTLPKRAPASFCLDRVIWGCGKASVSDESFASTANDPLMVDELLSIPQSVGESDAFNRNQPAISEYALSARNAMIQHDAVGLALADAQAAPEKLDVLGHAFAQRAGHDDAGHVGLVEAA